MKKYACEVEGCSNHTSGALCVEHKNMLDMGYDSVMCGKCGTVIKVLDNRIRGKPGKVEMVEECYICTGKRRKVKYPWED